jgi:ADP-ribosyl-[dinitrogen reductase] hydrolase
MSDETFVGARSPRPSTDIRDRARGCAVGAAVGDALGMPLEFGPPQPAKRLVREMRAGRLPPGTFTDDTEMALALAESLLTCLPLNPADLAQRFAAWYQAGPADVGNHTRAVLARISAGETWEQAVDAVQRQWPESAGNGSVMRCWPVALAHWADIADVDRASDDQELVGARSPRPLVTDSRLQSRVTHPHPECQAGSSLVNLTIYRLMRGASPAEAVAWALDASGIPKPLRAIVEQAPVRRREELENTGWVRHTLESTFWSLLNTDSFEEAVVQVVNLGRDADTAGAVIGALAGAAYGLEAIPARWRDVLRGEGPLGSGRVWRCDDLIALADELISR